MQVTGGKAPEARSYHAMAACGDAVYVFGGCDPPRSLPLHGYGCYVAPDAAASRAVSMILGAPRHGKLTEAPMQNIASYSASDSLSGEPVRGRCGEGKRGRLADLHRFDSRTGVWRQLPSSESIMVRRLPCCVGPGDRVLGLSRLASAFPIVRVGTARMFAGERKLFGWLLQQAGRPPKSGQCLCESSNKQLPLTSNRCRVLAVKRFAKYLVRSDELRFAAVYSVPGC